MPSKHWTGFQFRVPVVSDTEHRVLIPEGWSSRLLVLWTSLLQCRTHWSPLCRRKLAQSAVRPLEKGRKMRGAMAAVLLGWILDSTLRVGGKTKNHRLVKRYTSFPIIILAILTFQVLSGTHPEAEEPWPHMAASDIHWTEAHPVKLHLESSVRR